MEQKAPKKVKMTTLTCPYCDTLFKSQTYLSKHQKENKNCIKYREVTFMCRKCDFKTEGLKHIEKHIEECQGEEGNNLIENLEKRVRTLEDEKKALAAKKKVEGNFELKAERIKNSILCEIVKQKLGMDLSKLYEEKGNGLHVYDTAGAKLDIYINGQKQTTSKRKVINPADHLPPPSDVMIKDIPEIINTPQKQVEPPPKTPPPKKKDEISDVYNDRKKNRSRSRDRSRKKQNYRNITNKIPQVEEPSQEEYEEWIAKIDSRMSEEINDYFGNKSLEEIDKAIESCFVAIKDSRTYNKSIKDLNKLRRKMMPRMSMSKYVELIDSHIQRLTKVFRDKGYQDRKILEILCVSFSAMDARFIKFGKYFNTNIDADDICDVKKAAEFNVENSKALVPFKIDSVYHNFCNYIPALCPLKKCLELYLFNRYGFSNLIYLPLPRSSDADPYSFYFFESFGKEYRHWKMDCRLEETANDIVTNVRPHFVSLFRKLYHDIYGDNDYRTNYTSKNQVTEVECEQLAKNILELRDPLIFSKMLREVVKTNATYAPTNKDKFNLSGDDVLQKEKFSKHREEEVETLVVVKSLFDEMSEEQAKEFLSNHI